MAHKSYLHTIHLLHESGYFFGKGCHDTSSGFLQKIIVFMKNTYAFTFRVQCFTMCVSHSWSFRITLTGLFCGKVSRGAAVLPLNPHHILVGRNSGDSCQDPAEDTFHMVANLQGKRN